VDVARARLGPRVVVAGTHSGSGKTTVATGIMAALVGRGTKVGAAKVGPDYIDPGYHSLATDRPGRNLDSWMCGPSAVAPLAARAAAGAELLVVEGVMGLFDGAASAATADPAALAAASTAEAAALLAAPIVLVVDAAAMGASVAAVVHGYSSLREEISLGAVILNRVGSDSHEEMLRHALEPLGVPVIGALRRDPELAWRDRHLGLLPVVEAPAEIRRRLDRLAAAVERCCDLDALVALARSAPALAVPPLSPARPAGRCRVGVVGGAAFSFSYRDNLERLSEAGAELVPVDPSRDTSLPDSLDGLYAPGGFPEIHLGELATNTDLLADVGARVRTGLVTWAECGGLLWLCRSLDGRRLCGAIEADARMTERLTLGYRTITPRRDNPVAAAGTTLRGHEFRYSQLAPPGDALEAHGRDGSFRAGYASRRLLASYLHLHLGADPSPAERFVAVAGAPGASRRGAAVAPPPPAPATPLSRRTEP
jgi:cobyrinic acid a,c-diamide synthase